VTSPLVKRNFFRYYKTNLNLDCKYWKEDFFCGTNHCATTPCEPHEVPENIKKCDSNYSPSDKNKSQAELSRIHDFESSPVNFNDPDNSLNPAELIQMHDHWDFHDNNYFSEQKIERVYEKAFCPEEQNSEGQYYDLLKNPERYTGYSGDHAHRVWKKIYDENCYFADTTPPLQRPSFLMDEFMPQVEQAVETSKIFGVHPKEVMEKFTCIEKRVFYRAVSGMHTSISVTLAQFWWFDEMDGFAPNIEEFKRRFEHSQGAEYVHNLYFVWLLELRALTKAAEYLIGEENIREIFHTGDVLDDIKTQSMVIDLLTAVKEFPVHFDESSLFQGKNSVEMMEHFRQRMHKTAQVIDCADCEKCRLWGKIQIKGLATAVRILLTPSECIESNITPAKPGEKPCGKFKLTRGEIVALINSFHKLSNSVEYLEKFKNELLASHKHNEL